MSEPGSEPTAEILAAGGLVWRPGADGQLVCLVHRPRYDDWSLPKGKLKRGEHPLEGAVREVAEETGVNAVPQLPLPPTRYRAAGVPKRVDYWAMTITGADEFRPNSEVDQVAWLPPLAAADRVRYPHDAQLLRWWAAQPPVSAVVLLVRHADAGARLAAPVLDRERPLSSRGGADADALCRLLDLFAPARLVSASPRRCQETLLPLAVARNLPVEVDPVFDEEAEDPDAAGSRLVRIADTGGPVVICSQRAVIPPVLARLAERRLATGPGVAVEPVAATKRGPGWETGKGDGWLLSFTGSGLLAMEPVQTPRVRQ